MPIFVLTHSIELSNYMLARFRALVLGGGGGRPDYLQKLKVPEGYEKMNDYSNILHRTAGALKLQRGASRGRCAPVSKPNFASKYAFESSRRDLHNALLCTALKSHFATNFMKFVRI